MPHPGLNLTQPRRLLVDAFLVSLCFNVLQGRLLGRPFRPHPPYTVAWRISSRRRARGCCELFLTQESGVDMTALTSRKPYPSDVSDDEGVSFAPYLSLIREDVP